MLSMQTEQIVITGVGLASSLGVTAADTWRGILASRPSLTNMPALETPPPTGKGGYQAAELPADFAPGLPREVRYLRWTIRQSLDDAGLSDRSPYAPSRCGFVLGTTLHGMRAAGDFLRDSNRAHLRGFLAGSTLQAAVADLPIRGDAITTCSACSSSLGSIALAITLLEAGELDLLITGGYDAVSEYAYAGFNSLRLVAEGPLRPFAKDRQGMKLGEGYGILVLEREADAMKRGAKPLAAILGCGESADAHHLTQPHPHGLGAAAAIGSAIRRAGIDASDVDFIAAHATGTPDNDAGEYAALLNVFGPNLGRIPVVGFKSHIGHTLGGAGAVELILSAFALREQISPACASVAAQEIEFPGLSVVTGEPRKAEIRATLNTSLGFGGANTCAILARSATTPDHRDGRCGNREVLITGIGVIVPGAVGGAAFVEMLRRTPPLLRETGAIAEDAYLHLLNARRVRRMNDYVKLTLAATTLAHQSANIIDLPAFFEPCAALLGTAHGGSNYCASYYSEIVKGGMMAANPMLFAEGVPNAAAAHLSLMLSLKGACQTVIGSRTAGLDALRLASLRIAGGQWDRAVVGAAEEFHDLVNDAYRHCGLCGVFDAAPGTGFIPGAGAVTLLLESRQSMEQRGGKAIGRVMASASARIGGDGNGSHAVAAIQSVYAGIDSPRAVVGSANNTWVDRAEAAAIGRERDDAVVSSLYGHIPELFSAAPLAAVAAVLLDGKLPLSNADGQRDNSFDSFGVLCTGYTGTITAVRIARP